MVFITLKCWHCGHTQDIRVPREPQFAFELVGWAHDTGMVGYFDSGRARALIFCSKEHAEAELTKAGHFRLRAKGPVKVAA